MKNILTNMPLIFYNVHRFITLLVVGITYLLVEPCISFYAIYIFFINEYFALPQRPLYSNVKIVRILIPKKKMASHFVLLVPN